MRAGVKPLRAAQHMASEVSWRLRLCLGREEAAALLGLYIPLPLPLPLPLPSPPAAALWPLHWSSGGRRRARELSTLPTFQSMSTWAGTRVTDAAMEAASLHS